MRRQSTISRGILPVFLAGLCAIACGSPPPATLSADDAGPADANALLGDGGVLPDASSPVDGGEAPDGSTTPDAGAQPDASMTMTADAGPGLSCGAIAVCSESCGADTTCRDGCYSAGTPQAQNLDRALDTCLDALCSPTGVCASVSASCQMCRGMALVNGCAVLYGVCEGDMSGGPDAGVTAPDGGSARDGGSSGDAGSPGTDGGTSGTDGGSSGTDGGTSGTDGGTSSTDGGTSSTDGGTSGTDGGTASSDGGHASGDGGLPGTDAGVVGVDTCLEVSLCAGGCGTTYCTQRCLDLGTAQAQTEYLDLVDCITGHCPGTDGGVCDSSAANYNAGACDSCHNMVGGNGGICSGDVITCSGTPCASDTMCPTAVAPRCETAIGLCVQCLSGSDCGSGEACVDNVCRATGTLSCVGIYDCWYGCRDSSCPQACIAGGTPSATTDFNGLWNCNDAVCPNTPGGICDAATLSSQSQSCDMCIQNAQNNICLAQLEACVSNCITSSDCIYDPTKPACDTDTATCVECERTADCPSGAVCASHVCILTCATTQDCPVDQTCTSGICVAAPCQSDTDCEGTTSTPHCDLATGVCGP